MGGGSTDSSSASNPSLSLSLVIEHAEEEESSVEHNFSELSSQAKKNPRDLLSTKAENGTTKDGDNGLFSTSMDSDYQQRRARRVYEQILQSYDDLRIRSEGLKEARSRILRDVANYMPGAWIQKAGDTKLSDYDVPNMTALLLVGPKGSGKSSLVNRISRIFEDDKFAPDRAQVSYNTSVGDGTYFLQEHIIPKGSNTFCIYDTRGIADDSADNIKMIKRWMTKGVCHGELVIRDSDGSSLRTKMKYKTCQSSYNSSRTRMVNFVIFVVNGLSILESMDSDELAGRQYNKLIASTYNCPYLSFKDDKPVIVVTHGDLLSLSERARVRAHLGELLSIPPVKQIFDIPDSEHPTTGLTILDMLRYSLEHSDRNFPCRPRGLGKVCIISLLSRVLLFIIVGIAIGTVHMHRSLQSEPDITWHEIRHLW